jgi:myo-inositol-1(or 4)-monophosphatase
MKYVPISSDHLRLLAIAEAAVRAGERAALPYFETLHLQTAFKKHREIVTKGDTSSNHAIISVLRKKTPSIPICSEEGADITADQLGHADIAWVLDPVDGSSNFSARLPLWGISLALVVEGEPLIGVISLPSLKQRYHAVRGNGAWMGTQRLRVSKTKTLRDAVVFMCYGYRTEACHRGIRMINAFGPRVQTVRRLGTAVIEASWVANGHADVSILDGIHPWDVAAGALLVREAGGKALTFSGREWTIMDPDIIFTTPKLAAQVVRILKSSAVRGR